jgi:uncharacterized protein (DUF1778 family)
LTLTPYQEQKPYLYLIRLNGLLGTGIQEVWRPLRNCLFRTALRIVLASVNTTTLRHGIVWKEILMPPKPIQPAIRRKAAQAHDRRKPLNMRILPETRALIDLAAEVTGKNLTDFVLDAARQAAQNALLDRSVIPVSDKAYAAFVALLDAPPQLNERLRKSLQTPPVWA